MARFTIIWHMTPLRGTNHCIAGGLLLECALTPLVLSDSASRSVCSWPVPSFQQCRLDLIPGRCSTPEEQSSTRSRKVGRVDHPDLRHHPQPGAAGQPCPADHSLHHLLLPL